MRAGALREYYGQWELMFLIFNWHFIQSLRGPYSRIQSWMFSCTALATCSLKSSSISIWCWKSALLLKNTSRFHQFLKCVNRSNVELVLYCLMFWTDDVCYSLCPSGCEFTLTCMRYEYMLLNSDLIDSLHKIINSLSWHINNLKGKAGFIVDFCYCHQIPWKDVNL